MEIIEKRVNDLIPYERNPRNNDMAVDAVASSIREFGFKVPIVIDKDGVIIAGHTRLKAAKQLELETVPCIIADDLSEEQVKAFRLADNKVGEIATWDIDLLTTELEELDIDMSEFGFNVDEIGQDEFEPINDEELPDTQNFDYILKFGNKQVIMTEDEYRDLLQRYNEYAEENGVTFGFVRSLLNG